MMVTYLFFNHTPLLKSFLLAHCCFLLSGHLSPVCSPEIHPPFRRLESFNVFYVRNKAIVVSKHSCYPVCKCEACSHKLYFNTDILPVNGVTYGSSGRAAFFMLFWSPLDREKAMCFFAFTSICHSIHCLYLSIQVLYWGNMTHKLTEIFTPKMLQHVYRVLHFSLQFILTRLVSSKSKTLDCRRHLEWSHAVLKRICSGMSLEWYTYWQVSGVEEGIEFKETITATLFRPVISVSFYFTLSSQFSFI